jgi:hypothetical protein
MINLTCEIFAYGMYHFDNTDAQNPANEDSNRLAKTGGTLFPPS